MAYLVNVYSALVERQHDNLQYQPLHIRLNLGKKQQDRLRRSSPLPITHTDTRTTPPISRHLTRTA